MAFQMHELAKRTGLSKDTLRYYIKIGLLKPQHDPGNGYQLFNEKDITRLHFICKAKYLGFSLKELEQIILECEQGNSPCLMVREFLRRHIESNKKHLAEHLKQQQRMEAAWDEWQKMPDCQTKFDQYCTMIESVVSTDLAIENVTKTRAHSCPSSTIRHLNKLNR